MSRRLPITLLLTSCAAWLYGCNGPTQAISELQNQVTELQREKRSLTDQVALQDKKLDKLKKAWTQAEVDPGR